MKTNRIMLKNKIIKWLNFYFRKQKIKDKIELKKFRLNMKISKEFLKESYIF